MKRKSKDIWVIRIQVLFTVRVNKTLPAVKVVYIMKTVNEYWYERQEIQKTPNPGQTVVSFALLSVSQSDWTESDSHMHHT